MQRPEVRIVANQEELTVDSIELTQYEIDNMLAKYGYSQNHQQATPSKIEDNLTFEELIRREEANHSYKANQLNRPHTYTFDPGNIRYQTSSYGNDDENGFGFKIVISSDMDINGDMYK